MPVYNKNVIVWNVNYLTKTEIAKYYLKKYTKSKIKSNIFDATKFVKNYVDNDVINKSKKLSLDNAPEYFVRYYVKYKALRYDMTFLAKLLTFIQERTVDSMKQVPINATRFVIETKCL